MATKKAKYTEPKDFIPKSVRKEFKLGEFNDDENEKSKKERELNQKIRDFVNGKKK